MDNQHATRSKFELSSLNQSLNNIHKMVVDQALTYLFNQLELFVDLIPNISCELSHEPTITQYAEITKNRSDQDHFIQDLYKLSLVSQFDQYSSHVSYCKNYFEQIQSMVSEIIGYMNQYDQSYYKQSSIILNVSKIDSKKAYKELIDPISNQKRLDILIAISDDKKRFKDLEKELNLQAGHLIYHLNPLKEGKYVGQDSKKNYFLTNRGKLILSTIKRMYDELIAG